MFTWWTLASFSADIADAIPAASPVVRQQAIIRTLPLTGRSVEMQRPATSTFFMFFGVRHLYGTPKLSPGPNDLTSFSFCALSTSVFSPHAQKCTGGRQERIGERRMEFRKRFSVLGNLFTPMNEGQGDVGGVGIVDIKYVTGIEAIRPRTDLGGARVQIHNEWIPS